MPDGSPQKGVREGDFDRNHTGARIEKPSSLRQETSSVHFPRTLPGTWKSVLQMCPRNVIFCLWINFTAPNSHSLCSFAPSLTATLPMHLKDLSKSKYNHVQLGNASN